MINQKNKNTQKQLAWYHSLSDERREEIENAVLFRLLEEKGYEFDETNITPKPPKRRIKKILCASSANHKF